MSTHDTGRIPMLSPPVVRALITRPGLWPTAFCVLARLAVPGWWRTSPFLPLPDRRWWAFRMVTAYGRPDAQPVAADVVSYLEWCRSTGRRRVPRHLSGDASAGLGTPSDGQSG